MSWFLIALIGPVLWAVANYIDKYLLSDKFEGANIGALMIFSSLFCGIVLPILYLINTEILLITVHDAIILIFVGILSIFAIMPYMYALDDDEASIVVPLFQIIPIWGYLFAYFMLGEVLTPTQFLGSLLVITGSFVITVEIDNEEKIKFKKRTLGLMLLSTLIFAFYETLFKFVAADNNFVVVSFWEYIGVFFVGLIFYIFVKNYRDSFNYSIKNYGARIFSLNILNESLTVVGNIATNFALLIAPVTLVLSVSGVLPIFVFIIGIFLTFFFPNIHKEKISKKHLVHKIVSISLIVAGGIIIS